MISTDSGLKTAIYNALCACLGLAPSSSDAKAKIREAYNEPENSPRPARNVDVVYWSLSPDSAIADPPNFDAVILTNHNQKQKVSRTLPYILLVVCYGPSAEANAIKIRSFLYVDGVNSPRKILRASGIYPVPEPGKPELLYEPEGSLWRRRADLEVSLLVKDDQTYSNANGTVQTGPFVRVSH